MHKVIPKSFLVEHLLPTHSTETSCFYKKSIFCIQLPVPNGLILYHTLTKEMIILQGNEVEIFENFRNNIKDDTVSYLIQSYFIVPNTLDEALFCTQIISMGFLWNNKKSINKFTIMTTLDCNARCYYCYENEVTHCSMSLEMADAVVGFIKKQAKQDVSLNWFGGEPLYNLKVIDYICNKLKEENIPFSSKIISNGYLFDEETTIKAKNEWNLKKVQITLDGTEKIYNSIKAYIYDENNPFNVVTDNIENLLKNNIHVSIRLNVTGDNLDDLYKLVDYLSKRYHQYHCFYVYTGIVVDYSTINTIWGTDERNEIITERNKLEDYILKKGLKNFVEPNNKIRGDYCMASNESSTVIAPNGDLCRCEHYSPKIVYGNIKSPYIKEENYSMWEELFAKKELCDTCAFLPMCHMLKNCPANKDFKCNIFERNLKLHDIKIAVLNKYNRFAKDNDLPTLF